MPATRQTARAAARTRPFNPITPRSGCSPANSVSHGRNAPVAIIAPPATAARAKRRPSLRSRLARAHIEEQIDVGQDLRRDLRAGRIGGLERTHRDETLPATTWSHVAGSLTPMTWSSHQLPSA